MTATQEQLAKLAALVNAPGLWEYPALDTPAGDDVFLAPLLRWLRDYYEHWTSWGQCGDDTPCEAGIWYSESKDAAIGKAGNHTTALLRACIAAGLEEICEIFGKGE